jgi:NAD(P)H-hydrate epimerase
MILPVLKPREIRALFPRRAPDSHKGMNGRVMIVGGSIDYFGAPLLSGLGAVYSGVDLVHLFVPECNFEVSRSHYPDFIVHKFPGEYLDMKGVEPIIEYSKKCDVILMGPGLGEREETFEALLHIVQNISIPTILDASAIQVLQKIKHFPLKQKVVITPHHNEFEHLTGKDVKITGSVSGKVVLLRTIATDLKINILLKGPNDFIASEYGEVVMNSTGNAGMTVGGSGDVLAGFVSAIMAHGANPYDACRAAAYVFGKTGDLLLKQKGYCFSASDLAFELPYVIREFTF